MFWRQNILVSSCFCNKSQYQCFKKACLSSHSLGGQKPEESSGAKIKVSAEYFLLQGRTLSFLLQAPWDFRHSLAPWLMAASLQALLPLPNCLLPLTVTPLTYPQRRPLWLISWPFLIILGNLFISRFFISWHLQSPFHSTRYHSQFWDLGSGHIWGHSLAYHTPWGPSPPL